MLKFYKCKSGEKHPEVVLDDGTLENIWSNDVNSYDDAAIKVPNTVVVVDFDNHSNDDFIAERLNLIIDYFQTNYPTFMVKTNSGYHLYYRKPKGMTIKNWTNIKTTYGIPVDYKTGVHVMVKQNGKARATNKPFSELKFSTLPELPLPLYPIIKSKEVILLGAGIGIRDDNLYKHLMNVKETYSNVDISKVAFYINDNLFVKPLPEKQVREKIENVLNAKIKQDYYSGDPKDMISFAEWLIKKLDIKMFKGKLYFYNQAKYISDNRLLLKETTKYLKLKRVQDNELIHQITKLVNEVKDNNKMPIKLNNAFIDIDNSEVIRSNICDFTVFNLDVNYNPDAYDEYVDEFLNDITCGRKELRQVLEEVLGHILITNNLPAYVFFLKGNGKNGKSTFLEMINNFVGDVGCSISLEDFNDATSVASLIGKLVNCSDETDQVYIEKCKGYKTLASGNSITVRPIYSQPIKVKNTATLILNANKMPNFKDKTGGFFRRLTIIPFDYDLEKDHKPIPKLIDKLSTDNAKSYILNLALGGLKRINENNNAISFSTLINNEKIAYRKETDSVVAYLSEYENIDGNFTNLVYSQYDYYCGEIGKKAVNKEEFTTRLKEFGYTVRPKNYKNKDGKWTSSRAYFKVY